MTMASAMEGEDLQSFETKMEELILSQWKLQRDHLRGVRRATEAAHRASQEKRQDLGESLAALTKELRAAEAEAKREREERLQAEQRFARELGELRQQQLERQEAAERARAASSADVESRLKVMLEEMNARRAEQRVLEDRVDALRSETTSFQVAMDALRDSVCQDTQELRTEQESLATWAREHDRLSREARARESALSASVASLKETLEHEREDRDASMARMASELDGANRDLKALREEELPPVRASLKEQEDALALRVKEQQHALDRAVGDHSAALARCEQRASDALLKIEGESAARTARDEEVEQSFGALRSKLSALQAKQAEASRHAAEVAPADLRRGLETEALAREGQCQALQELLSQQKASVEERLSGLQKEIAAASQRVRAEARSAGEEAGGSAAARRSDELSKQVRDLREALISRVSEERAQREVSLLAIEENVQFMNHFFRDIGERFGGIGGLRPNAPIGTLTNAPSGYTSRQRSSANSPLMGHPFSQSLSASARRPRNSQPPQLDEDQRRSLAHVLDQDRLQLLLEPSEVAVAELRLKEPLAFRAHDGNGPLAVVEETREEQALEVLGDVAEFLGVYRSAVLLIEGHADVPKARADERAMQVALARAETVKSSIASFGVQPGRLEVVALPLNEAEPDRSVVLKIVSF